MKSYLKIKNISGINENLYKVYLFSKDVTTGLGIEIVYIFHVADDQNAVLIPYSCNGILKDEFKEDNKKFVETYIIEGGVDSLTEIVHDIIKDKDRDENTWYDFAIKEDDDIVDDEAITYMELFKEAVKKLNIDESQVSDWRPACHTYLDYITDVIPYGILIWFKDGTKIIYIR